MKKISNMKKSDDEDIREKKWLKYKILAYNNIFIYSEGKTVKKRRLI